MTGKIPFPELNSDGIITLTVVQGNVPSTREDAQLSQITRLCSLMAQCWKFEPTDRPSMSQCRNEVASMVGGTPMSLKQSLTRTLSQPSTPPSGVNDPSAKLLIQMGHLHRIHDRHEKAVSLFRQALATAELKGGLSMATKAAVQRQLGHTYCLQNKYSEANESFIQAREVYTRIRDHRGLANTLGGLGELYFIQNKYSEAEESFIQAQEICTRIGDDLGWAEALRRLGNLYYSQTKYSEANESFIQAQQIYTRIGNDDGRAITFVGLGDLYHRRNKDSKAEESFIQA